MARYSTSIQVNTVQPQEKIASVEASTVPYNYAFPGTADTFPQNQSSIHTIQIHANKTTVLDSLSDIFFDDTPAERQDRINNTYNTKAGVFTFYLPSTMVYTNSIDWQDISLTSFGTDFLKNAAGMDIVTNVLDIGSELSARLGLPINPKAEVIFRQYPQRVFQFDFLFAPTNQGEDQVLKKIIQQIRAEAAPQKVNNTGGFIWRSPATFDIQFMHNGQINEQLPKIQQCVCEQVDVNMAPSGVWSTFTTGFPTAVRLTLKFREKEPNDRDRIEVGF